MQDGPDSKQVLRKISLTSAVFLFVGYIVGASIFILPGSLGAITGPGLFVAYLLAAVPAALGCAVAAQVGSAYPVAGASYIMTSRVLGPFWGSIVIWLIIIYVAIAVPLVALGFADYLDYFIEGFDRQWVAASAVILFAVVNIAGVSMASSIQGALVVAFCIALLIFGVGGVTSGNAEMMQPLFPEGISPVLLTVITVYFSYTGALVITEMAGEIKEPEKNIPRAIIIGFVLIIVMYTLVPIALMMNLDWRQLSGSSAIAVAAEKFLPLWLVNYIALGALLAAGTSVNGVLMAQSRDVLAASREGLLPEYFIKVSENTKVPVRGILLIAVLSVLGIFYGATIKDYADMAVLGFMVLQGLLGYAVYKLPISQPETYTASRFKYSPFWHNCLSLGSVIVAVVIIVIIAIQHLDMLLALIGFLSFGSILFFFRRKDLIPSDHV